MVTIRELEKGNYIVHESELCQVKNISMEEGNAIVELNGVFSGNGFSLNVEHDALLEEVNIIRKCGHVISKKEKTIEIMDSISFKTFDAEIDSSLFNEVNSENKVTYIQFNDKTKILEVRK